MENYNRLIKFYEYFYQKIYNPNFEFNQNDTNQVIVIWKFIDILDENISLGDNWLFNYFAFQFEYWVTKKYKAIKGVVTSYIFGAKAYQRFNERNEHAGYFTEEFIRNYKVDINDLVQNRYYQKNLLELSKPEEIQKKLFSEPNRKILNCIEHTTLFNIKSQICVFCSKSKQCKEIQQKKYPGIYKIRNNGHIKEIH